MNTCNRYIKSIVLFLFLGMGSSAKAQTTRYTLQDCIRYAREHNLDIKSDALEVRNAKLVHEYSKYGILPSLSVSSSYGGSFGRSVNPTTNQFENTRFSSLGLNASSNVLLFGWFQKRYGIQSNALKAESAELNHEQLMAELVLTVSTAYLRALLAKEQEETMRHQITVSESNKSRIEKMLSAGKSNILELSQAKTQLSTDSSNFIQAVLNKEQALIDLKAVLNFSFKDSLEIERPEDISQVLTDKPDPEYIYSLASGSLPQMKNMDTKERMAAKQIAIAKSAQYPQLNLYVSAGTNYSSSFYEYLPSGERQLMNFGKQIGNNRSQSVGLGLSIPIFNGLSIKQGIKQAQLQENQQRITNEKDRQKIRQDIYKACIDYELTRQKQYATESTEQNAATAFNAASTRYQMGFINQFEFITEKNNYLKAQNENLAVKYDLYFKKLVLDYYSGVFRAD